MASKIGFISLDLICIPPPQCLTVDEVKKAGSCGCVRTAFREQLKGLLVRAFIRSAAIETCDWSIKR